MLNYARTVQYTSGHVMNYFFTLALISFKEISRMQLLKWLQINVVSTLNFKKYHVIQLLGSQLLALNN